MLLKELSLNDIEGMIRKDLGKDVNLVSLDLNGTVKGKDDGKEYETFGVTLSGYVTDRMYCTMYLWSADGNVLKRVRDIEYDLPF